MSECVHGHLARSCVHCELAEAYNKIEELEKLVKELKEMVKAYEEMRE